MTVLIVLAVVLLIAAIVFLIVMLQRWRAPESVTKEPGDGATETPPAKAGPAAPLAVTELATSFQGALGILRSRNMDRDFRYTLPWYLLIGESGSGKTALLDESTLALEIEEQVKVEHGAAVSWNFLGHGVVLDLSGEWSFAATERTTIPTWRRLLHLIARHRPERPLDGIVVTISARDFCGPKALDQNPLIEKATFLQQRLQQIQALTSMHLPVYFVLTHSETVEGFRELATSLHEDELDQIFGWSNPFATEVQFNPEWTDLALNAMRMSVEQRLTRLFATCDHKREHDALFLLPGNLLSLQPRLRIFMARVLRSATEVPVPYFRGIFLTGSIAEKHWQPEFQDDLVPVSMPGKRVSFEWGSLALTNGTAAAPAVASQWAATDTGVGLHGFAEPPRIVFARDLLLKKVFPERTLARPLASFFNTRNRLQRGLETASGIVALLLTVGMILGFLYVSHKRDRLLPLLTDIANDLSSSSAIRAGAVALPGRGGQQAVVVPFDSVPAEAELRTPTDDLIRILMQLHEDWMRSLFYPISWSGSLDNRIKTDLVPSLRILVLERFEHQLEQRARQLTNPQTLTITDAAGVPAKQAAPPTMMQRMPEYQRLRAFDDQIAELQKHINQYAQLSEPNSNARLETLVQLDSYLNRRPEIDLPTNVDSRALDEALAQTSWRPFRYSVADEQSASIKMQDLAIALFAAAIEHNAIRTAAYRVVELLNHIGSTGTPAYEDLVLAKQTFAELTAALDRPDLAWVSAASLRMPADLAAVTIAPLGSSAYLPATLAPTLEDAADASFRRMSLSLQDVSTGLSGRLLEMRDGRLQLTAKAQEVQVGLDNLLNLPFMTFSTGGAKVQPMGTLIDWDKPTLDIAAALPRSLQRYLTEDLDQAPAGLHTSLDRIARQRVAVAMENTVTQAELPGPRLPSDARLEGELQPLIEHFVSAAPSLRAVLNGMHALNLAGPYERLQAVTSGEAQALLAALDRSFNAEGVYSVPRTALERWDGSGDLLPLVYNVAGSEAFAGYLAAERDRVRTYSAAAQPLVAFLTANGSANNRIARRWIRIAADLAQYEAKRPGNAVQVLEGHLATDLSALRVSSGCTLPRGSFAGEGGDFFAETYVGLRDELRGRCDELRNRGTVTSYATLAAFYNSDLAGRFPFASLQASMITEADPQQIAAFFKEYDAATGFAGAGSTQSERRFLAAMAESRPFFVALTSRTAASIDFIPRFRVHREREFAGDQVASWTLEVGQQIFRSDEPEHRGTWNVGDPVTLTVRWARNAAFVPTETTTPTMHASAQGVVYRFTDPWALLRMAATLVAPPLERNAAEPGSLGLLELQIPEVGVNGLAKLQPGDITEARVFMSLTMLAPGKPDEVGLPALPLPLSAPPPRAARSARSGINEGNQP
jgi:type VI secretion system protein ImpL